MMPLFSRCLGMDRVVAEGTPLPEFDLQAPLMSLPGLLDMKLSTIPDKLPYLFADEKLVAEWRQRLAVIDGYKIGILWQGNPHHGLDHYRSIPLRHFASLSGLSGVQLISLQRGAGREQLKQFAQPLAVIDFGDDLDQRALLAGRPSPPSPHLERLKEQIA